MMRSQREEEEGLAGRADTVDWRYFEHPTFLHYVMEVLSRNSRRDQDSGLRPGNIRPNTAMPRAMNRLPYSVRLSRPLGML